MGAKRVLIAGITANKGGVESYIMEIYRHCDKSKLQFDFLSYEHINEEYKKEIEYLGGHVYFIPAKRKHIINHYKVLNEIFLKGKYTGVYYQCNRKLYTLDIFKYAKKYNVPIRAIHSHNSTQPPMSFIEKIRSLSVECRLDKYVTDRFACSDEAGKWMFGDREYKVIKNAVDTSVFFYNMKTREKVRKELGLDDKLLVGTVGRLSEQKNPFYIVEIINKLCQINENIRFIHIGDGKLKEKVKEKIEEYSLRDKYLLLGLQKNVSDYMNAMDYFILPSKFEGFPIVLVEAQATGLHCMVSDNITNSCDLTGNIEFLSTDIQPQEWAERILNDIKYNREDCSKKIIEEGYDINCISEEIQKFFLTRKNNE